MAECNDEKCAIDLTKLPTAEVPSKYKEGIVMLTVPNCDHCKEQKELLKNSIDKGEIKLIDMKNDQKDFLDLINANKEQLDGFPFFIKDGNVKCDLFKDDESNSKTLVCDDGTEVELK